MKKINNILSIAGTDPSSGAGIQADLKTFSALGTYGASVITCIIAQNTYGIQAIYPLSGDCVTEQLNSVFNDIQIDSVKIGLLCQATTIRVVSALLENHSIPWIVLDTVMKAKSGDQLLAKDDIKILQNKLLPLASIITPNLPEAAVLLGCKLAKNEDQMCLQGRQLLNYGCKAVLMKGGHLISIDSPDWLVTSEQEVRFTSPRVQTKNTHGTGCTFSAAIAALRPRYDNWKQTIEVAKNWLQKAILHADKLHVGQGKGPIHHFYKWW
ncbi:bifunctional hydroxymethylpyrimidine kinase/phosphomethylpyrimidine kinase [Candidatus Palibaumannia cicadellinicola]|uniref:hydroxymethylpyrimidine kinase n=1 Tax=Baumannia cicadellinicola subsp. Homalodisca coagulata TaxID=374463 RepID=Q1LSJ2_BAUCH|nr:bifunctional hydroxymethylpyrimidine kinase/phosphomethylpyrimidine kinase [Candidatus Baumannia cicadellinicola]ABF13883.1 phosphomethylpyrimidine kinase [Baumannia cicadellinicola str. Hc (Homalodisca coagulata)]MCJ7461986.1 bifunctional hydroxymethylpyrimidine kinase/phosphomethylpyrimidine kinase [Candidatus Baumannia cicadellinicola]MCJ7462772.1 bifunctional hydroxymethylpyrimidine kinase/phosphomethylpyrimidine kinase [Candidatus Baumannia cicadellinicola]